MQTDVPLRVRLLGEGDLMQGGLTGLVAAYDAQVVVVAPDEPAELALHDPFPPGSTDAVPTTRAVLGVGPDERLVLYSWCVDPVAVERAVADGYDGYLPKSLPGQELAIACEKIHAGERLVVLEQPWSRPEPGEWPGQAAGLNQRESQIVALITQGLSNDEIARCTYLSLNTVKSYIRSAYATMGVGSRTQAVLWGLDHGFSYDRELLRHTADLPC